jgi:uncharacterized protein with HEPN domain
VKGDQLYIEHILECIARIERYTKGGESAFHEDSLIQDGVLRNLQVLAESIKRPSDAPKAGRPEVDWRGIAGFRNVLVHDYLGVTVQRVWDIVALDLPMLKAAVGAMRGPAA